MNDREIYERAHKRVKAKKDFYSHLTSYFITMIFLFFINVFTSPGYLWVMWPAMGWGIGLAFHAVEVFGVFGNREEEWEEQELKKEIARLKRNRKYVSSQEDDEILDESPLELKELRKEKADWDDKDFV